MVERVLVFEEFDIDDPIFSELSDRVYDHFIQHVVSDVTDKEIRSILRSSSYDNPFYYANILGNTIYSDDIPKEGPTDYYITTAYMILSGEDPIRLALYLVCEYIVGKRLISGEIDEYVDNYEDLYRSKVRWLRKGLSPSCRMELTEDSGPEIYDELRTHIT